MQTRRPGGRSTRGQCSTVQVWQVPALQANCASSWCAGSRSPCVSSLTLLIPSAVSRCTARRSEFILTSPFADCLDGPSVLLSEGHWGLCLQCGATVHAEVEMTVPVSYLCTNEFNPSNTIATDRCDQWIRRFCPVQLVTWKLVITWLPEARPRNRFIQQPLILITSITELSSKADDSDALILGQTTYWAPSVTRPPLFLAHRTSNTSTSRDEPLLLVCNTETHGDLWRTARPGYISICLPYG